MPDTPLESQPNSSISEEEPDQFSPVLSPDNPSADGGETPVSAILPTHPTQPRAKIRAAINSIYNTPRSQAGTAASPHPAPPVEPAPKPGTTKPDLDPVELEKAAEVQSLLANAQVQARQGRHDAALKLLSKAVQRDPLNSEAWTWLGGLLIGSDLEHARECLQRAIELDTGNERARRGLAQVEARLQTLKAAPASPDVDTAASETESTSPPPEPAEEPARADIKIGLEEAVETRRKLGQPTGMEIVPVGGARFRPAIEKGELRLPRVRRRRLQWLPQGLTLSMVVLGLFLLIIVLGTGAAVVTSLSQANPTVATEPTYTPAPLTVDEAFAAQLRIEVDRYNRMINTARNLRQQVQQGKVVWEDYRKTIKGLQAEIKNEKRSLDSLAPGATPRLIPYYRNLQTIAQLSTQAVDFNMSGIENTNPEDLEESNRQFNDAARQLAELVRRLNLAAPVPTIAPTPTIRPTTTPVPTAAPTSTPAPPTITPTTGPLDNGIILEAPTVPPGPATPIPTPSPSTPPPTVAPTTTTTA